MNYTGGPPSTPEATTPPPIALQSPTPVSMHDPEPTGTSIPTVTPPTKPPRPTAAVKPNSSCNQIEPGRSDIVDNPRIPPHAFVGRAIIDGEAVREGVVVNAWVEGQDVGSTTTVRGGTFTILVSQPEDSDFDGEIIFFTVGELVADSTAVWHQGGAKILNLHARSDCQLSR